MAGGVITQSSFAKALWPGINAWWGEEYNEFPVEYTKLFDTYKSRKAFEEDVQTVGLGLAQVKPEGTPINYDAPSQAFITRYSHLVYALGFIVTREAYEDDQYDVVGSRKAKSLAFSMRQTKEIVAATVYNRAFTGTGNPTYGDGSVALVATHPRWSGGTFSNVPSVAIDLSEAALEQAVIDIGGYTDDRGLLIAVRPKTLIIPRQLAFEAERITKTALRVGTNNNDVNAIKSMGLVPEVVVNHYLTDSDAWFLRTDVKDGMKHWERRGDEFDMDEDFDTENAKYKATARYSFGLTDPKALYGSAGS
jgi:hypothetical protein